ncbi:MAG: HlyD family efflux transporter periplasmic adaptor subunit [Bacteroidales bacterium]|nr:HlyD family efflux transporter periplasmic adaptor subunit [Bacteroidales bacterium]
MKERKPDIIYSEPVNEIMGNPPGRITRWGTTIIISVFCIFILFAWLIRYPDTIPSPVEITTVNPPVTLVSKMTGRIKYLYVKDRDIVSLNQLVGVMETTASIDQIKTLRQIVDTIGSPDNLNFNLFPSLTQLGELQGSCALFLKNLSDFNSYTANDYYGNKILSLEDEISGLQEYINRLKVKETLYMENRALELKKYRRDSVLYAGKVIPESQLEISRQALIGINIELQQVRLEQSEKKIAISEKYQLLIDYRIKRVEENDKLESVLRESLENLRSQLSIWENNYLLISPIDGVATFTRYWSANQSVTKDEPVITIVPPDHGKYIGRITLKMQRSGKVIQGRLVNIKLAGYPYLEYGMVRGVVKSKSLVPAEDAYIIEIDLPNGLTTLYGKKLEFTQNMQGTAEIITDDIRLLQKIINPFRYMVSRNKR